MDNELKELFSAKGRLRRSDYILNYIIFNLLIINILFGLVALIFNFITSILSIPLVTTVLNIIIIIIAIAFATVSITIFVCSTIKRLHDLDKNGNLVFLAFIPVVNIIFFLLLFFKDGNPKENEYGINPKIVFKDTSIENKIVSNQFPNIKYSKMVQFNTTFDGDYNEYHLVIDNTRKELIYNQIHTNKYYIKDMKNKKYFYKNIEECLDDLLP